MALNEFLKYAEARKSLKGDEIHWFMNKMSGEARRMTFKLNGSYHGLEEIRELLSRLFGKPAGPSFRAFPPFYTGFGKNITVDKNAFINAYCHFQGHDGVTLGDGYQIGHSVIFATLSHSFALEDQGTACSAPIVLKKNTWIDSSATILSGVTTGENAIVGVGSVITRDIPDNAIMGGVPAEAIKCIQ